MGVGCVGRVALDCLGKGVTEKVGEGIGSSGLDMDSKIANNMIHELSVQWAGLGL